MTTDPRDVLCGTEEEDGRAQIAAHRALEKRKEQKNMTTSKDQQSLNKGESLRINPEYRSGDGEEEKTYHMSLLANDGSLLLFRENISEQQIDNIFTDIFEPYLEDQADPDAYYEFKIGEEGASKGEYLFEANDGPFEIIDAYEIWIGGFEMDHPALPQASTEAEEEE